MIKVLWVLRALIYKPFFGKFCMPSYIGKPIYLKNTKRIFIGKRVRIFPGIRLEVINKVAKLQIQENVAIGQNVHITCGKNVIIGKNTLLTENIMITDIDHDYKELNTPILKQENICKETVIGQNCFIGFGAVIQAGTKLGKHCIVGSNAVVRGEFPDYCVIVGIPARIIKRYDFESKEWRKTNKNGDFV